MYLASVLLATALLLAVGLALSGDAPEPPVITPPAPRREFRGVWVATVANIDWPSRRDLTTDAQKAELLALLDQAEQMRLNAVVLQVRPACDALYASTLEPWSEYLTGTMGKAPEPFYDPLAFAVEEAHRRGLELHAWFNPYRARHSTARSEIAPDHISRTQPQLVKQYGRSLWLDPGEKAVQAHSLRVIQDVVRRYDIDGVHLDDYFYPYKERDEGGTVLEFPDETSWRAYQQSGGKLSRNDWRRDNINTFVQQLYRVIKVEKPWVKFGISPFGIWRPGNPPQIQGFDAYEELYADSRTWLQQGWVDYFTPQLYWKIEQTPQSYPILLNWWAQQNTRKRHLWPGNFASRVPSAWPADELVYQIRATRGQAGATGNIHFSAKAFLRDPDGLPRRLTETVYDQPALVPASPWLDSRSPLRLKDVSVAQGAVPGDLTVTWQPGGGEGAWVWLVQSRVGAAWTSAVVPGHRTTHTLPGAASDTPVDAVAVAAVDRTGNAGPPFVVAVKRP